MSAIIPAFARREHPLGQRSPDEPWLTFGLVTTDPLRPLLDLSGVADGVAAARHAVDGLLANRTLRRRSADVSAESALRGAWASAWLAGAEYGLDDVRSGAAASDPVVQGALRAQSAIGVLADTWTRAPRQALARLHALAAADLVADPALLGRPSAVPSVAIRLDTLAGVLAATSAPAVVVAGIVHGELLSLDAFPPMSGVVARVAVRLTLVERGLDPKSLVVIEAGHRELRPEYDAALAAYGTGTPEGIAEWLRHCVDAMVAGTREALAICEAIARG
ncbi:MAG: hypothetical protein QOG80_2765 [Pseudonocardiales bacterium]|nr:hypothetical protein [Pseudonocardiales bacterium]